MTKSLRVTPRARCAHCPKGTEQKMVLELSGNFAVLPAGRSGWRSTRSRNESPCPCLAESDICHFLSKLLCYVAAFFWEPDPVAVCIVLCMDMDAADSAKASS